MRLCLNAIVKNESGRIERMLASVAQFVDAFAITDTGSTDDTVAVTTKFFEHHKIPGQINHAPFENWSQARNAALDAGRSYCRAHDIDYLLLVDADMELVVKDVIKFLAPKTGPSYDMFQQAGALHYMNRRLVHAKTTGKYLGVTHEYLGVDAAGKIDQDVAYFVDHADGSNRPEKFKRDIQLLLEGLKTEPNNERYYFYLAQSYRDAGEHANAAKWYQKRVKAGGWDEEVWQAQLMYAHCLKSLGDEAGFLREALVAYDMRPKRAEALYDLSRHYRDKSMNAPALAFAEAGLHLPLSEDALFVNNYVYDVGLKEEVSITGFYVPGKRQRGYEVTNDLSLKAGPYGGSRELARHNMYHYLQPLGHFCPSFTWKNIDFNPPADWAAMNPSVMCDDGGLVCNIRCVNYNMDEHGRYLIRGMDGATNQTNPIITRNFIVYLRDDLEAWGEHEIIAEAMPCEFPLVIGLEDVRLFRWKESLYASATVRQIHPDGNCEQVLARVADDKFQNIKRMLRQPRATEKNWAPMVGHWGDLSFMWRPGEVVDTQGTTISKYDTGMATDHISGGSQLIQWREGWIGITHEARFLPDKPLRYYIHRFAYYNDDGSLNQFSMPFYFNDKVIEFCAGMCYHPDGERFVISYGYKDAEARIATVSMAEVTKMLRGL